MNAQSFVSKMMASLKIRPSSYTDLKHYILQIMFTSALAAILLIWLNEYIFHQIDSIDFFAYPIFSLCMVLCLLLLYYFPHHHQRISDIGLAIFSVFLLLYAYHLYSNAKSLQGLLGIAIYIHFASLIYIAIFAIFTSRKWLIIACLFLIGTTGFIVYNALYALEAEYFASSAYFLIDIFILHGLQIAALMIFAQIKDQFVKMYIQTETLTQLATIDHLTGIANRRHIEDVIAHHFRHSAQDLAIIMIDIDHFKNVNDSHGHDVGDQALIFVARNLRDHVRTSDTLGRWGGEEFVVVAPNTDRDQATHLAERLRLVLAEARCQTIALTASFGVAIYNDQDTADSLIKRADRALYRAKELGRNRVEVAS